MGAWGFPPYKRTIGLKRCLFAVLISVHQPAYRALTKTNALRLFDGFISQLKLSKANHLYTVNSQNLLVTLFKLTFLGG